MIWTTFLKFCCFPLVSSALHTTPAISTLNALGYWDQNHGDPGRSSTLSEAGVAGGDATATLERKSVVTGNSSMHIYIHSGTWMVKQVRTKPQKAWHHSQLISVHMSLFGCNTFLTMWTPNLFCILRALRRRLEEPDYLALGYDFMTERNRCPLAHFEVMRDSTFFILLMLTRGPWHNMLLWEIRTRFPHLQFHNIQNTPLATFPQISSMYEGWAAVKQDGRRTCAAELKENMINPDATTAVSYLKETFVF